MVFRKTLMSSPVYVYNFTDTHTATYTVSEIFGLYNLQFMLKTYQWVFFRFSLSRLFAWVALLRYIVPVEPYVLWPKSQQGMPFVLLWTCQPREALHHPLCRVFPCCFTPIHLQNTWGSVRLLGLASYYSSSFNIWWKMPLPVALLSQPPACKEWWSSSTDQWTTLLSLLHPLGRTERAEDLRWFYLYKPSLEGIEKLSGRHLGDCDWLWSHSPIVTSEELCVSRKRLRLCQTHGIHSIILTSSPFLTRLLISVSRSLRRRNRPRKPFTGSVWLAHKTHLK